MNMHNHAIVFERHMRILRVYITSRLGVAADVAITPVGAGEQLVPQRAFERLGRALVLTSMACAIRAPAQPKQSGNDHHLRVREISFIFKDKATNLENHPASVATPTIGIGVVVDAVTSTVAGC